MNFMLVFDVIILVLGVYIVYSAFKMKKSQEVSTLFVASQEMAHCHDPKAFVEFLVPKAVIFGGVSVAFGILNLLNDLKVVTGTLETVGAIVEMTVFVASWIWFSQMLRKGKKEFF